MAALILDFMAPIGTCDAYFFELGELVGYDDNAVRINTKQRRFIMNCRLGCRKRGKSRD